MMTLDYVTIEGEYKNIKTKAELDALKGEYDSLKCKLQELSEDALKVVTGGIDESDEMIIKGAQKASYATGSATTDR